MAQAEEGRQGRGCTASAVRGGADLEGGQSASTEVEHTLTVHIHTHQEAQQRKGVVLCRRGPLSFCLRVRTTCSDGGKTTDVSRLPLNKGSGRNRRGGDSGGKIKERIMEEEEEEVLCYLDRVLEEEVFEYGDGELDPITPVHRQFKVRQRLDAGTVYTYAHAYTYTRTHAQTHTHLVERLWFCKVSSLWHHSAL